MGLKGHAARRSPAPLESLEILAYTAAEVMPAYYCVSKPLAERVDPEVVEPLGVTRRDVVRHALVEPEPPKDTERRREPLLAVQA